MLNVGIVENSPDSAEKLIEFLERFSEEQKKVIKHIWFQGTKDFLEGYHFQFDLIFMDIELDDGNGMDVARELRKKDPVVMLIFITHLAKYAVQSYEVDALDYILKPVRYPSFELKMKRALGYLHKDEKKDIMLNLGEQLVRMPASSIKYIEIYKHHIVYHTENGDYETYGVLKKAEEALPMGDFFRLGSSFIVNLRHIQKVSGQNVVIDDREIPVSRLKKKEFLAALHNYYM